MRCEIVAVGTELLLGQIHDTNSSWIGEQLALAGIDSHHQCRVGDNLQRIVAAIRLALQRADAVVLCGGLGPTQDDITREAIAEVMGVPLERDPSVVKRLREMFRARGREMPDNNLRQADVPRGAALISQMPGTAPGLICPLGAQVIYAVPGVPSEMRQMVAGSVIPDLQRRSGEPAAIRSRVLRTWGQSESGLAEMLASRIAELDETGNPTLAFLASGIEGLKVRITAKADDAEAARSILDDEERRLRRILGDLVFGIDDQTMESVVLDLLRARGATLGLAESLTGGLVGARLTAIPGASAVFRGSVVAYAAQVKRDVLGLAPGPVVSEEAARAMALGARRVLGCDVALSATGVAGPEEQDGQPVGTVFLGLADADETVVHRVQLPGRREVVRNLAAISLLNALRLRLGGATGRER